MKNYSSKNLILNNSDISKKIQRIALQIIEDNFEESEIKLFGISDNGNTIAQKIIKNIEKRTDLKTELIQVKLDKGNPIESIDFDEEFDIEGKSILIIDQKEKKVSSSEGHLLMSSNPFSKSRFIQANENVNKLKNILIEGDLENFVKIIELEALSLHAMMMTSYPSYILMHPNTLFVINEVHRFRDETSIPICFTLDAGANVHLLYPKKYFDKIQILIKEKLLKFCDSKRFINDHVGFGSKKAAV